MIVRWFSLGSGQTHINWDVKVCEYCPGCEYLRKPHRHVIHYSGFRTNVPTDLYACAIFKNASELPHEVSREVTIAGAVEEEISGDIDPVVLCDLAGALH
jgi:hypothetical protein